MKNTLLKRALSLAMAVFMVVSLIPAQAFALGTDMDVEDFYDPSASADPYYCPTCKIVGDWEDVAEGAWNAGGDILGDGKHYRLTGDQNIAAALIVAADKTVCIDLNGHNITAPKTNGIRAFEVSGVLTISDSAETDGKISGGQLRASGGTSDVHVYQYGGNILISGASAALNLYGGEITGGQVSIATFKDHANGGNIGLTDGATFNMYGGTVTDGYVAANQQRSKASNGGGNIYAEDSNVNIYGGTVSNGEVYAVYSSSTDSGRDARGLGGNIAISGGAFFMEDGTVTGGLITTSTTATSTASDKPSAVCYAYGGNIYCYQADVKICGGTISDGTATAKASAKMTSAKAYAYGGNLYISGCTFTMTGGTVSGGSVSNTMPSVPVASTCEALGGNVYFNNTTATIKNATFQNGAASANVATTAAAVTATTRGGNIYIAEGSLAMTKTTVSGGSVTTEAHTTSGAAAGYAYGGNLFTDNTAVEITSGEITGGIATLTGVSSDNGDASGFGKGGNLFVYSEAATPAAFHIGGTAVISGGKATTGTVTEKKTSGKVEAVRETHGGNICSGGVDLVIDGDARVEKGLVVQNMSASRGGNIYITSKTVTLSGNAVITGGQSGEEASDAARGGNIFVGGSGTFDMRGGSVTGGKAGWGTNIMLMASAKMNLYDGTISGDTSKSYAIMNQRGTLKIYGGTVKMSDDGYSAVSVQGTGSTNGGTAHIYGGEIEKIYITYASTLNVYGGKINAYAPASNFTGTTRIYAAELGFDPGANVAGCANVVGGGDTYIVWHNAGTCATCGHTFGDVCATCGIAHGISDCYHIYENGACKFCGMVLAAHTATCAHGCENVTWLPFDGLAVADGGHYYLNNDMVLLNQLNISNISVCIDLNGYTVTGPEAKRCFYITGAAGELRLMDSSEANTGTLKGAGVAFNGNGGMVYVGSNSAFYLYDATVTGGITTADRGANLYTTNGLIVIDNGKVTNGINRDGEACRGGNVCLYDPDALLIMKGSDAKITGGMVDGPHAYGGNIYCGSGADIVIYDGEISGGYATRDGANIELMNGSGETTRGLHYMYGGTIGDVHPDTPSDVSNFVVYGSSYINDFYVFGGHIQSMNDSGANNEVKIYGGTFGFDPRTADDKIASDLGECACVTYDEATGIYTVVHTAGTGTCDICAAHDNGPEEYTVTYTNTGTHTPGEGTVVEPNCSKQGYTESVCTVCGSTYQHDFTATNDVHDYDENGDCTRCDAAVVAKVTDTEGNETWYATFADALAFANGKGYTVKALKNISEKLQTVYGTSSTPIRNVTIDANPGITITDTTYTSGTASYNLYLRGVTLTQNANLIVKCGLSVVTGESTINGSTQSYTLSVADGATLNINGTVTNDGNAMINGTVKVNEGGTWNANNNSNPNFIGLYNGAIEVNGGTINCDNFKPTHSGTGTVSVTLNNATLNAREAICVKKLALTMEGTNTVTLCGEAFDLSGITVDTEMGWVSNSKSFIEAAGYDIDLTLVKNITIASSGVTINYPATVNLNGHTLSGPVKLAEGGSLTLVGENTGSLTVTTELADKCVWVNEGVYTTGDHVYTYDPTTGEGTCNSGCGATATCTHQYGEYTSNGNATCTEDGTKSATCSVCGHVDTVTDAGSALGHAYGNWIDNGENHKKVCANGCGIDLFEAHNHDADVTEPDCENGGYTTHTCICGNTYTDSQTDATGHAYGNWIDNGENHKKVCANGCGIDLFEAHNHDEVVTKPTCEADGYTTHTCVCGNTYTDTPTDATGHAYGNWIDNGENHKKVCANDPAHVIYGDHAHDAVVTEPDCVTGGYTTHTCVCGNTYTDSQTDATGHAYGNWIDNGANHKKVCANGCGIDLFEAHNHDADVTEPDCENGGYTTHTCVCGNTYTDTPTDATGHAYGNWIDNGENHKKVCANDPAHVIYGDHAHDAVVTAPDCVTGGYTTHTCECGNTYVDTYTDPDGVAHDYDEFGDCTRCDASVIAKVTYKDGTVSYYATFLEALVAANNTGATVKALKNVAEVMQPTFSTEDTPLTNVVIDSNPGVTITDLTDLPMDERPDHIFAVKKVTFAENVNFSVSMILNFRTGESVINGTVNTYILSFHGATLVLNGTLNNTGNAMLTTGHVIVNEGGTWNANTNPNITNFLGVYGGVLEINGGTVNCDNFKAVGRNPNESEEGTANRDATVIIRNGTVNAQYAFAARKLHLTLEGENTINVCDRPFDTTGITYETANGWVSNRKSFDETDIYGVDITLMSDITLADKLFDRAITIDQNGYVLKGTATVAEGASVTLVGEKNEKLNFVAAQEGKCVWPTDNGDGTTTYAPAEHQFGDWTEGVKKCANCGVALGCDHNYTSVVTNVTCESDGYTTHTCTICGNSYTDSVVTALGHAYGAYIINEDGTHTRICGNDATHVETAAHAYETVVTAPNCSEQGYTTYTCICTHTYVDNYTDPDGVTHDYDEFGDCTRCDASVIAKVTYKDGTVVYYTTFLEALVAANGTGATVKALKNVAEVMQPTFGLEEAPLTNVIIDSNPGVTITDTTPLTFEESADHNFHVKKLTFTENTDFSVKMILRFHSGNSVVEGKVSTYILGISGANLTVNGELNNTGNAIFSSGHVTVNEGAVWNANTNSNHNFIGIYGGTLEINGGTVNCDMFKSVGRNPDDKDDEESTDLRQERDATVIIRNGTLNAREAILARKTHLTLEGENIITLKEEPYDLSTITYETVHGWITTRQSFKEANVYDLDMTLMANVTLADSQELKVSRDLTVNMNGYKLAGPLELVEGGSLTLVGENTGKLEVTTTLEGKCVWVTPGEGTTTYTTADHVLGEWTDNGENHKKACINCGGAEIFGDHEDTAEVTAPTCEADGYTTHTCAVCGRSYTDETVPALGHAWGNWTDDGDAGHSRVCGNDATHIETLPHTHDAVVTAPNCSEQGYTTHTCQCGNTYVDTYTDPDGVTHDYDEFGDCTRCDASVIAKVTYTDGTVEYYTTFLEALVAAQNTGATVKALKNVEEVMQPTFSTDKTALRNVIIDCNPGVTIKDTTPLAGDERPDHTFYLREVTFTENADFSVNMILHYVGKNEVSEINGKVTTYILFVGDADVQVNGTLNNTGNVVMNSGSITINEGGVWNANTNTKNHNFVGLYGGTIVINGGTVNCDNFKPVGSTTADANVIIRNGTLNAREAFCARKLNLTLEGENTITVAGQAFDASVITYETANGWVSNAASFEEADDYNLNFTLMDSFKIDETAFDRAVTIDQNGYTLTGDIKLAEGGVVTLTGEKAEGLTITTDLEGKCVWVTTDGETAVYVADDHVYGNWVDGKQTCVNCGATAECAHNYESVVTDPTCEADGYTTHTCTICGNTYTDTPVDALGHEYDSVYTAPTATANGYTTYTCKNGCNHSYVVEDENSMLHCAQNVQTGVTYDDLQLALNEAAKGQTVKLLRNVEIADVYVGAGKTLDLNGFALTVTSSISASFATSHIIDTSAAEGRMITAANVDMALNPMNAHLPVWTADGTYFVDVNFAGALDLKDKTGAANEDVAYFRFAFDEDQVLLDQILANGSDGTGLTIRIKVAYTTGSGMQAYQYFDYSDEMVEAYYNYATGWKNAAFRLYLSGVEGLDDMAFTAEIVSTAPNGTRVIISSAPWVI